MIILTDESLCPKCESDEIYYENKSTGYGGYVCIDCGYEYPKDTKYEPEGVE